MSVRIGIMGFGRIGRNVFRLLRKVPSLEIAAIADVADPKALEYLLRFDTVHGRFDEPFRVDGETMTIGEHKVAMLTRTSPAEVDWASHGVSVVVDATHKYRSRAALEGHLKGGAKRVILMSPPVDPIDRIVIAGVNHGTLKPEDKILSIGSPTANCVVPILKVLNETFGIERGFSTTVHAYTSDQRLADVPNAKDLRRSRAAAENIIPADSWWPTALPGLLPELAGKIEGMVMYVPVPDGSTIDLTTWMKRTVTAEEVNAAFWAAAAGSFRGIIEYTDQPLVSSDVIGNPHSGVFDSLSTQIVGGNLLKTVSWFDNGWGYASRAVELIHRLAALDGGW